MKFARLASRMLARLRRRVAERRAPDQIIGGHESPYMLRWFLVPRNRLFNVYLHHFMRSDDDRALHDHPWWNISFLLEGAYTEHTIAKGGINVRTVRQAGALKLRRASAAHRIELHAGPCWTLFLTGPKIRSWGFHCARGWVHWRKFTAPDDGNIVGPGCAEDGA